MEDLEIVQQFIKALSKEDATPISIVEATIKIMTKAYEITPEEIIEKIRLNKKKIRPRGRPPKGKTWSEEEGKYI